MSYLLVVDDDLDFADAAAYVLRSCGHEVAVEASTRGALKSIEKRRPDLAILDVMFPEDPSAGFELARMIRHLDEGRSRIPILLLTAVNTDFPLGFSTSDAHDAAKLADAILEKPVDLEVLKRRSEDLLRHQEQPQSHGA